MTAPRPEPDLESLRRLLHAGDRGRKRGPAERLAHALIGEPAPVVSCVDVQAQLPVYVEAELRGVSVAQRYPGVARHLLSCEECGALYALVLDRELAPALEPLPAPVPLDVLRQEQRFEEVRCFVVGIAEAALKAIRPAALPGLADAVQVVFGQLREEMREPGGALRLEPATAFAMGQGGELSPAARFVMASFLATQQLAQAALTAQPGAQPSASDLAALARKTAEQAAKDCGLKGDEARRFAGAYAELIAASAPILPEWPTDA